MLSHRLDNLTETYKQTLQSIHKIPRTPDPDDLSELTGSIRDALNSLTEDLDLLNLSLDELTGASNTTRPSDNSEDARAKLRLSVQAQRLGEDIRNARQSFRRTQIYARKADENARRREREDRLQQLRQPPRVPEDDTPVDTTPTSSSILPARRRKGEERPPEEADVLVHASGDVLAALRQTHALLAGEVERSQFAAEVLAQSTRELEQLNTSYTDLDALLKTSKGLVSQLMRTRKSDTWYLTMARGFLLVVLGWLVWRRLLWGPTWWVLWLPMRILYATLMAMMAPLRMGRGAVKSGAVTSGLKVMPSASERPSPVVAGGGARHIPVGRGGGGQPRAQDPSKDGSLSQKIGKMVEQAEKVVRGDGVELEDSDEPRNPKKRVMEAGDIIDELEHEHEESQDQPLEHQVDTDAGESQMRDEL